jgi:hypothetical protein
MGVRQETFLFFLEKPSLNFLDCYFCCLLRSVLNRTRKNLNLTPKHKTVTCKIAQFRPFFLTTTKTHSFFNKTETNKFIDFLCVREHLRRDRERERRKKNNR